jgi:hypothetical protein
MLGLTQTQFGASVGTSAINVQQIENGITQMSRGLARRISWIYGLDPGQLITGAEPDRPRLAFGNRPFTKEGFERLNNVPPDEIEKRRQNLFFILDLVFDAADEVGRYNALMYDVLEVLKARVEEFGLTNRAIEKLATYGAYPTLPEMTRQIYDMLFSPTPTTEIGTFIERREQLRKEPKLAPESQRSSPRGKSPKRREPRPPRPGRDSAARKP